MTQLIPLPESIVSDADRERLLIAMLRDEEWFSASWLEAVRTGRTGMTWREKVRGEVSYDDWTEMGQGGTAVRLLPRLAAFGGSLHDPEGRWDVPFRAEAGGIVVPDNSPPQVIARVRQRLLELAASL